MKSTEHFNTKSLILSCMLDKPCSTFAKNFIACLPNMVSGLAKKQSTLEIIQPWLIICMFLSISLSYVVLWSSHYSDGKIMFFSTEESAPAEDCCHGDLTDDLDPGLGLLAEPQVVVTVRRLSLSLDCAIAVEPEFGNLTYVWRKGGEEIHSR